MLLAAIAGSLGLGGASISAPWSDISFSSPTANGSNEDRTITGSGTVYEGALGGNTIASLEYRINSGSWTSYPGAGGFSITSGQTLAWRVTSAGGNQSAPANIFVNGNPLDSFQVTVTGF
jgi:hypothetical protein